MRQVIETTITTYSASGQVVKVSKVFEEIYDEGLFVEAAGARTPAPPKLQAKPQVNKAEKEVLLPRWENLPASKNSLLPRWENMPSGVDTPLPSPRGKEVENIEEACAAVIKTQQEAKTSNPANREEQIGKERLLIKLKDQRAGLNKAVPTPAPASTPVSVSAPAPSALHRAEEVSAIACEPFDLDSLYA